MFSGIVKGGFEISQLKPLPGMLKYAVRLPKEMIEGLEIGASVSIDGICQSVVKIEDQEVWFDAIEETLRKTTLGTRNIGDFVNIERAVRFSDEIGGHILSGHVYGTARIGEIVFSANNTKISIECPTAWMKYFFSKGFIAIDGISLTIADVSRINGTFSVHLIPETLRVTTLAGKQEGDLVNIEIDSQTQILVESVERILQEMSPISSR